MTCNDCLHLKACEDIAWICRHEFDDQRAERCYQFKNKADFVEVVRCKECKYLHTNGKCYQYPMTSELCDDGIVLGVEEDHFCGYGERKDVRWDM